MGAACKQILNLRGGSVVCERAVVADRPLRRMRGLLGRGVLAPGEGMLLTPAPSIHTAFMRFSLDVVFADRGLRVVKVVPNLGPWRVASARHARYALELAAGEAARRGIRSGDQLAIVSSAEAPTSKPGAPAAPIGEPAGGFAGAGGSPRGAVMPPSSGREGSPGDNRPTVGQAAIHVLLIGSDRRFRTLARTLLEHRGLIVATAERAALCERQALAGADVVLLDAGESLTAAARDAAALSRLAPDVAVITVAERPHHSPASLPVLAKWGSFDAVVEAIETAYAKRRVFAAGDRARGDVGD